jgi:hypothetical protein
MNHIVHAEIVARRKLAPLPQGWIVSSWKPSGKDGILLSGGVPHPVTLWGDLSGKLFEGEPQSVLVSFEEIRAESHRFEAATGKCGDCLGSGRTMMQERRSRTARQGTCPRCAGTRRAPTLQNDQAHVA